MWKKGVIGAAMLLACSPASAQERANGRVGPEIAIGVLEHGANFHPLGSQLIFDRPALPPGQIYDGSEEDGTVDVQLAYRTAPLRFLLKPRLAAKLQINTAGRTSFASLGAEWRQHALRGRVYAQGGIGVTIHNGYSFTPDPFAPGLSGSEAWRRYDIYRHHTAFGSRVLFNPNASIGVRLDPRWAVEATWEHFSHRRLFSDRNPGIDNVGIRLVRTLGRR
ncbi:acyloxyacyl hydrolase [Sphingomonas sp. CJ20]